MDDNPQAICIISAMQYASRDVVATSRYVFCYNSTLRLFGQQTWPVRTHTKQHQRYQYKNGQVRSESQKY